MSDPSTTPPPRAFTGCEELLRAVHHALSGSTRGLPGRVAFTRAVIGTVLDVSADDRTYRQLAALLERGSEPETDTS